MSIAKILFVLLLSVCIKLRYCFINEYARSSEVRKFWGMQDVAVTIGKLLRYEIPHDAFKGTIMYYEVEGEGNRPIPKWLIFNKKTATLEGVPSENDIGDTQINVKAYDNKGRYVSDMFIVEVYPLLGKNTNRKKKCRKGDSVMMFVLVVGKKLEDISPSEKVNSIKNLSYLLHIPVNTILLLSQNLDSDKSSVISSSNDKLIYSKNYSILTWQIGCDERIWEEQLKVVELVKEYFSNEKLLDVLNLPIKSWHTLSHFKIFRTRRHLDNSNQNDTEVDIDEEKDEDDTDEESMDDEDVDSGDNYSENGPSKLLSNINPTPTITDSSYFHSSEEMLVQKTKTVNQSLSGDNPVPELSNEEETTDMPDEHYYNNESSLTPEIPFSLYNATIVRTPILSTEMYVENTTMAIPKRYPPKVIRYLEPLGIEAGVPNITKIPNNIFIDDEDGNTRNLTLRMNVSDTCAPYTPFVELNSKTQEIYIVASLNTISRYEFTVEAIDSDGMIANNTLMVDVQNPKNIRLINFEISLHMKLAESQKLTAALLFQLLNYLAKLYGDSNYTNIIVRNITCNPFIFTFTNKTLPLNYCDNTTILNLLSVLTDTGWSMNTNLKVQQVIGSEITVEKITWRGIGMCENMIPAARPPQPPRQNFKPVIRNHINNITARVGELMIFKVPEDTFYDAEESNTRNLKLSLLNENLSPVSSENWLQFDSANQEFFGLPAATDVNIVKYQLVCNDNENDSDEFKARHVIEVVVEPATKSYYSVEFSMKLTANHDEFRKSPLMQRKFIEKLASLFDDKNTSNIVVSGFDRGSLIVTWHNKSLPINDCPDSETYNKLRQILMDENYELNEHVNEVLAPDFEAISAQMSPIGVCEGNLTELHPSLSEMNSFQEKQATYITGEYFTNYILPIIMIVTMVVFASVIACILYRRQRSNKWLNDEDERRTYRSKGIPVIFQDELEERLEPTNKSPIILKEEKPPLPPPEYQKNVTPMATTALLSDFDDPNYQPSNITFTSASSRNSAERNGRSKQTPIYRKPPPYIPS